MTNSTKSSEANGSSAGSLNELLRGLQAHSDQSLIESTPKVGESVQAQLTRIVCLARAAGLHSYSSLTLRIVEHLEPNLRMGLLVPRDMTLLTSWASASAGYLNARDHRHHAEALIDLLAERFARRSGTAECRYLLRGLLQERRGADSKLSAWANPIG